MAPGIYRPEWRWRRKPLLGQRPLKETLGGGRIGRLEVELGALFAVRHRATRGGAVGAIEGLVRGNLRV